jgi:hypothetical protein
MINDGKYAEIMGKVQLAQQFDQPVILLYNETDIDDEGDTVDRLRYIPACNSAYEMCGMIIRSADIVNVRSVFCVNEKED